MMTDPQNQPPPLPVQPLAYAHSREQKHRLNMALWCLHIAAIIYLALAILLPMIVAEMPGMLEYVIFGGVCGGIAVINWVVAWGITRRYYWAWIAGIVVFAIYAPSLFFILGGLGLWGLLDEGSRAQFRQG